MDAFTILRIMFFSGVALMVIGFIGAIMRKPHALHTIALGGAVAIIVAIVDMAVLLPR